MPGRAGTMAGSGAKRCRDSPSAGMRRQIGGGDRCQGTGHRAGTMGASVE